MIPRVLVATPTYEFHSYCLDLYVERLRAINYPDFSILLVDNSEGEDYVNRIRDYGICALHVEREAQARASIVKCRNIIRDIVLNYGFQYLLFIDQDVFPPPEVISRLVQHNQPVVSGVYTKWALGRRWAVAAMREWHPCRWDELVETASPAGMTPVSDLPDGKLVPIYGAGDGCLLISRQVLEKIRFRYDPNYDNASDVYFAADVLAAGIPFYLDTAVRCQHFYVVKHYAQWKRAHQW